MSTPTSETLNGGSTFAPTQSDATKSGEGVKLPGAGGTDSINSGFNVGSQVNVGTVKPVDHKTIEGSTPGDFRSNPGDVAATSVASATDNGGPRSQVGQFPLSGKQAPTPAPESFLGADSIEQN